MKRPFTSLRWLVFVILVAVLAACSSEPDDGGLSLFGAQRETTLDSSSAESVFTTFMDAWKRQDYETMYSLIVPNARDQFTFATFENIYESEFRQPIGLRELDWQISAGPLVQGNSAMVEYSVDFVTDVLGDFSDPNPELEDQQPRVMYLVAIEDEGWRVAWSRMTIFDGWTSGSRLRVERIMPRRGNIYDRNGEILVSQNGRVIGIYVIENNMRNVQQCRDELARILRQERSEIQEIFDLYLGDFQFLVGEIPEDVANRENAVLSGVCNADLFARDTRQYYGQVAPHVLGYIGQIPEAESSAYAARGYPADALVGLDGLELAFEDELRGTIGKRLQIVTNTGITVRTIANVDLVPGQSLTLTLDRNLQLGVQQMLAEAYDSAGPTWGPTSPGAGVVVTDVNTGQILAMASYPDFDPSVFNPDSAFNSNSALGNTGIQQIANWKQDPNLPLLNRATNGRYPLGSVMKVFSMIAGLESGVWALTDSVVCTGTWDGTQWNAGIKTDWFPPGHGVMDMTTGLINSCNPFFWSLSVAMYDAGPSLLTDYIQQFGFGRAPRMQGIGTESGLIPNADLARRQDAQWTYADNANVVIGQGDTQVSPLQVSMATAAVANGGRLFNPMVVQQVGTLGSDPTFVAEPTFEQLDISQIVLQQTREAMCEVTTYTGRDDGTAAFIFDDGWYQANGYQVMVCGKTGTAETSRGIPHAWFNAFAPAENPQIAVAVIVENSCEGSEVAAPMTRRIMEMYFPTLATDRYEWPQPLWFSGCTQIGPGETGP